MASDKGRLPPLWALILAAMVGGVVVGLSLNAFAPREVALSVAAIGEGAGRIFLDLLKMVVVPLIFTSLVASIARLGGDGLGRLGARTVAWYLSSSALAICVGLLVVNLLRPGEGLSFTDILAAASQELAAKDAAPPKVPEVQGNPILEIVFRMIPTNVIAAASSNGSILAVVFFAVVFSIAVTRTDREFAEPVTALFTGLYHVMLTLVQGILWLAPIGIFGYLLHVTASTGLQVLSSVVWYIVAVMAALVLHGFVVLPGLLFLLTGRNPLTYARSMGEALATAFSTASSSGTLPVTLRCATQNAGVPERVASFTLPLGATVNMDGTALYEVVAVLFLAQMLGDLTLTQQGVVAFTALLVSVGAAGIPHAGTVMMVMVIDAVQLPVAASEAVLVMLSVDRILDMSRTTINVWSDSIGAAVVSHFESDLETPG